MPHRARGLKVDDNQGGIVKALRQIGAYVGIIGQPYDLLVGFRGRWSVLEVKDPSKPPSARQLTPDQVETLAKIKGAAPVHIVHDIDEALCAIGARPWPEDAA